MNGVTVIDTVPGFIEARVQAHNQVANPLQGKLRTYVQSSGQTICGVVIVQTGPNWGNEVVNTQYFVKPIIDAVTSGLSTHTTALQAGLASISGQTKDKMNADMDSLAGMILSRNANSSQIFYTPFAVTSEARVTTCSSLLCYPRVSIQTVESGTTVELVPEKKPVILFAYARYYSMPLSLTSTDVTKALLDITAENSEKQLVAVAQKFAKANPMAYVAAVSVYETGLHRFGK